MEPIHVPPEMFRFTTGDRAGLYVAVLHAFAEANERLETALSLDDIRARLRAVGWLDALDDGDLTKALVQLREWDLVDVNQNHAENYLTASDYERNNVQRAGHGAGRRRSRASCTRCRCWPRPGRCRRRCSTRSGIGWATCERWWRSRPAAIAGSSQR